MSASQGTAFFEVRQVCPYRGVDSRVGMLNNVSVCRPELCAAIGNRVRHWEHGINGRFRKLDEGTHVMKTKLRRWLHVGLFVGLGFGLGLLWNQIAADRQAQGSLAEMKVVLCSQAASEKSGSKESDSKVTGIGQVIGLRPEKKDYYIELHANTWPSVLKRIRDSNIRNYSIYLAELEGKLYLFSYFEYVGEDFAGDMARIAADPETQRWWKETDPCQIRLPATPEGNWWMPIPEVFHTD